MRILVSGGVGFIGHVVCLQLQDLGHEVMAFDNFSCYADPSLSRYHVYVRRRLERLEDKVRVQRGDVRNRTQLGRTFREFRPQVLVHLAAVADAKAFDRCLEEASAVNLMGTLNMLESLRGSPGVERFVYASSSFVYGDFRTSPIDEGHCTDPVDAYGATKVSGETLTRAFSRRYGVDYAIVRPSAVYGPTDANRRVSQIFIENALRGQELILEGGSGNRLDFTYVDDAAKGFTLAALHPRAANQTFNVTCGRSRSLKEYADLLSRSIPQVRLVERPPDPNRPRRGTLDISKARRLLGYEPAYSLEDGVQKYLEYVLGQKDLPDLDGQENLQRSALLAPCDGG